VQAGVVHLPCPGFGREGDGNFAVKYIIAAFPMRVDTVIVIIKRELPLTAQIQPVRTRHLRRGVQRKIFTNSSDVVHR